LELRKRGRGASASPPAKRHRVEKLENESQKPSSSQQDLEHRTIWISELLSGTTVDQLEKLLSSCLKQSLAYSTSEIETIAIDELKNIAEVTFKSVAAANECAKLGQIISFGRMLQIRSKSNLQDSTSSVARVEAQKTFTSFQEMSAFFSSRRNLLTPVDSSVQRIKLLLAIDISATESQVKKAEKIIAETFT